jgi:uncharacterized cofD-like protein
MTFGNLFMAALTDIYGSQEEAISRTCKLLEVKGSIIPVTYDDTHLVARYSNGKQVLGEHSIDEPDETNARHKIVELEVFPPASANPLAKKAIAQSDVIVLGPGDLFTSVLCNVVVNGVAEALSKTKAKIVLIINLMTRHGQTDNFSAKDHIKAVEKYIGKGRIDVAIVSKSKAFPEGILERYREEDAFPVMDDLKEGNGLKVVRGDYVADVVFEKQKSDKLVRSLIRHDSDKLAKAIISLL